MRTGSRRPSRRQLRPAPRLDRGLRPPAIPDITFHTKPVDKLSRSMSTTAPASPLPVRREATARALVTGCVIGGLLAAGHLYTALKTGFVDTGGITAALIAFMVFSGARRLGGSPLGLLENNIVQTTAASAAIMGFVVGLAGAVPPLAFLQMRVTGA